MCIVATMRMVLENQALAAGKAVTARAYVWKHFSWDRAHTIIRERIDQLIDIAKLTEEVSRKISELRKRLDDGGGEKST